MQALTAPRMLKVTCRHAVAPARLAQAGSLVKQLGLSRTANLMYMGFSITTLGSLMRAPISTAAASSDTDNSEAVQASISEPVQIPVESQQQTSKPSWLPVRLRNALLWGLALGIFITLPFLQPTWLYSKPASSTVTAAATHCTRHAPALTRPGLSAFVRNPKAAAQQYADYMRSPPVEGDTRAQLEYYSATNIAVSSFVVLGAALAVSAVLTGITNLFMKVAVAVVGQRGSSPAQPNSKVA